MEEKNENLKKDDALLEKKIWLSPSVEILNQGKTVEGVGSGGDAYSAS